MLKVLDKMVIKGFIGPCLLAFFVVEFVLIMQLMWKFIDDILGKGYGFGDYFELLSTLAVVLIPMSLPLTILLASVMIYGDLAEKHELGSMKSSGISLIRIIRPGLVIAACIAIFSFSSSNTLKPWASKHSTKKLKAMKTNQLTFAFDEKIFNTDFKNYSIRVEKKYPDGRTIEGALIYDRSDADKSILNMIRAKYGEMYTTPDQKYLVMDLKDGYQLKEVRAEAADNSRKNFKQQGRPVMRTQFSTLRKVFDLEELMDLSTSNTNYKKYETMNSAQLMEVIDSVNHEVIKNKRERLHTYGFMHGKDESNTQNTSQIKEAVQFQAKKVKSKGYKVAKKHISKKFVFRPQLITDETRTLTEVVTFLKRDEFIKAGKRSMDSYITNTSNNYYEEKRLLRVQALHAFTLHRMFSWASVCLIFLFIGAPAGALVRRGGFGYPMLIAIGFYLTFIMSSIIGEKLMRNGTLEAWEGAWLPFLILLPFAVFLTWRALNDRTQIVDLSFIKKLVPRRKEREL